MGSAPCTPVVLLGYHRPEMTARVWERIRQAQPSELLLVMDGAKPGDADDARKVSETRDVVARVDWECRVHRIYADQNLGLKTRVSSGLDEVFSRVDAAIILEDDCLPSPDFFRFATELLHRYEDDVRVGMITGSSRLRGHRVSEYSYDFSKDVRIWGWATWARVWNQFSDSGELNKRWSGEEQNTLVPQFPSGARRAAMKKMLSSQKELDSWALPFVVHCVNRGYLNPVPSANLVTNIGLGASSTHTQFESWVAYQAVETLPLPLKHPAHVVANPSLDETESRLDSREFWFYPLRHPLDAARRVVRYVAILLRRIQRRQE